MHEYQVVIKFQLIGRRIKKWALAAGLCRLYIDGIFYELILVLILIVAIPYWSLRLYFISTNYGINKVSLYITIAQNV